MAKVKRSIYRVLPITERHKVIGWKVTGPGGYVTSFYTHEGGTKCGAIKTARDLAQENEPSQVLAARKSRTTGKYRLKLEWSYGVDSKAKG